MDRTVPVPGASLEAVPLSAAAKARPGTTLGQLIDPELAALAMWSLHAGSARRHMQRKAQACTEAGRERDGAFWHEAIAAFDGFALAREKVPGR